ncbi:hypothetical protein D4764_10G0002070 [Takifugu flavidus]|uniref:EF-hand domain-containing protein n=1 Tax=Takifugu flavidus TaxID=433684 RepID=A0A5C6PL82_9TELE|nr:hypothetical protein D4764_10G0002070 [Takifugu flavidus]
MEKKELSIFNAMKFLKDCFDEHAAKDGEKATMTKKELADLLHQQFEITENHFIAQYFDGMDKDGIMEKKELSIFNAMKFLKDCFDEHAAKDGEKATMTKEELADLLRQQFEITENHFIAQYFDGMDKDGIMEKKELSIFNAMKFLKDCFDEHAAKDGEKATMTKKELADLLRQQFEITENHFIAQYFDGMDKDGDEKITFTEYMSYLTKLFEGF